MSLTIGVRLGPYQILSRLGAGGMGEVYRARDTRLGRDVALKVLPAAVANDAGRRARFEQEARAVAALNHPGIVTIHDVGAADGVHYLVTELIDGDSLRDIIGRGPMPRQQALEAAVQIAESLGVAHTAGIVHRDLKPENIMFTRDGRAKILDFGLAKPSAAAAAVGPETVTLLQTDPGCVVGTPAYMSPEQVRGQPLDHRTDIFSFGAILHEMLTGTPAFLEDSAAETMTAILRKEPQEISAIAPDVPPTLDRLLRRCLAKDPLRRFHSATDLAFALETLAGQRSSPVQAQLTGAPDAAARRRFPVRFLAGVLTGLVIAVIVHHFLRDSETPDPPTVRYLTYAGHDSSPDVSPDGLTVAFTSDRDGHQRIWLKQLPGGGEAPMTEGPDDLARFSPNGSTLLFLRNEGAVTSLYRSGLVASEPRKLLEDVTYADWSPDGKQIAFIRQLNEGAQVSSVVGIVGADGESPRQLVRAAGETLMHPRWSPDGLTIAAVPAVVAAGSEQFVLLIDAASGAVRRLPAPKSGFGMSSVSWSGDGGEFIYSVAESVAGSVGGNSGSAAWIISQNARTGASRRIFWSPYGANVLDVSGPGRLVFDTRSPRESLREIDIAHAAASEPVQWLTRGNSNDRQPAYSPDGQRVVFSSNRSGYLDLWELDIHTGRLRRLTDHRAQDWDPAYMPGGKRIVWSSNRGGNLEIWMANADGSGVRQITHDGVDAENPTATPDGNWILYASGNPARQGLWKIRTDGSQASRLVAGSLSLPETSPDGKFVSFITNILRDSSTLRVVETGGGAPEPFEVRLPIRNSNTGGSVGRSRWMPDGRAIAFIGQNEKGVNGIFVQDFVPGKDTSATRRPLCCFDPDAATESFGISPDGRQMTVAVWDQVFSLVSAARVPGVSRPSRAK